MKLYHGTEKKFENFNTEVVFFTSNIEMAKSYGDIIIEKNIKIVPEDRKVFVDAKGDNWRGFFLGDALAEEIYEDMVIKDNIYYEKEELKRVRFSTNDVVGFAKDLGKSLVEIKNVEDYGSEVENIIPSDVFVVINKEIIC